MKNSNNSILATALLAIGAIQATACPLAYVINFSGQFGIMDLATGAFTPVGKGLANTPDGIAGKTGGPFYTVDGATGHLLKIGLDGSATDVGDTHTGPNVGPDGVSVVGALTDGSLYALDFSNRLFRINEKTGQLTLIGALPSLPPQVPEYPLKTSDARHFQATSCAGRQRSREVCLPQFPRAACPLQLQSPAECPQQSDASVTGSGKTGETFR